MKDITNTIEHFACHALGCNAPQTGIQETAQEAMMPNVLHVLLALMAILIKKTAHQTKIQSALHAAMSSL